jgi:microcystin-dependent protein
MTTIFYPTGAVVPFAGSTIPNGWVMCDGSAYDGTTETYKNLWNVIGSFYGGSESAFRVPNLGNRVPVGLDSSSVRSNKFTTIGAWAGASAVTLSSSTTGVLSHSHSVDESAVHTHAPSWSAHYHTIGYSVTSSNSPATGKGDGNTINNWDAGSSYNLTAANTNVTLSAGSIGEFTINNSTAVSNASSAHSNLAPQLALHYIIKL